MNQRLRRAFLSTLLTGILFAIPGTVAATPINLSTWSPSFHGSIAGVAPSDFPLWQVSNAPTFDEVRQLRNNNHNPSVYTSDFHIVPGIRIAGELIVGSLSPFPDDDFVGFVFGWNTGDELNPNADYLLIDWKQQTSLENPGDPFGLPSVLGSIGMSLTRVQGIPTPAELFSHSDDFSSSTGSVLELQRAATLGSTGWVQNQVYNFAIDIGEQNDLQVYIDDVLQINYQWDPLVSPFTGKIGFYSFSQADTRFRNVRAEPISTIPEPSTLGLISLGLLGLRFGVRERVKWSMPSSSG